MIDSVEVDLSGPFFEKNPGETIRQNIERLMGSIAKAGVAEVRRGFAQNQVSRAPISRLGDRVADHIIGRTFARPSEGGRRWHASGVIQVYNEGLSDVQSRSLMAAAASIEGRQNVIRKATREIGQRLRQIDLTEGLD